MRLIDADVLLEQMKRRRDYVGRASDAVCLVEDAPTIEAEPVIHCKYCKHCVAHGDGKTYHCWFTGAYVEEDDYCSQAESESNMGWKGV